ncbi:MAG: putative capsid protein [Guiyang polycipivirus 1]|nr:MAG: putative capsid protein [Guiyang polycipivirus 1]
MSVPATNVTAEQPQEQLQAYPVAPVPERSSTAKGVTTLNSLATPELLFGTLKPTGSTIYINGDTNGSSSPLFAWRVTPFVPTCEISDENIQYMGYPRVQVSSTPFTATTFADRCAFHHPFIPLSDFESHFPSTGSGNLSNGVFPTRGICCVQYGDEPLLSRWCRTHRGWRGSMMYAFRTIANFTSQAYMRIMIVNGRPRARNYDPNLPLAVLPGTARLLNGLGDYSANGWVRIDASEKKHFNIEVPYERVQKYVDEHSEMMRCNSSTYNTEQYIVIQIAGKFTSQSGAQLQIEVEYGPGPDFKLFKPIGPFYVFAYPKGTVDDYGEVTEGSQLQYMVKPFNNPRKVTYVIGDHDAAPSTWPRVRLDKTATVTIGGSKFTAVAGVETSLRIEDKTNEVIISPFDQGAPNS